jgi:hypothetical protein
MVPKVSEPVWQFEHSVETGASRQFAWKYWTNVGNWVDPPAEFRIEGPFAPGSRLISSVPGQDPWHSVIREVQPGTAASIEMQLAGAVLRFDWRFDELPAHRTRITQRLTLAGENAAGYRDKVVIFESSVPEGMKRLATVMERAEARTRQAADPASQP